MIKFFLSRVLKWAVSIDWSQFTAILPAIRNAAKLYPKTGNESAQENARINASRAIHASDAILRAIPALATWQVNLIRELALAWLNRGAKA